MFITRTKKHVNTFYLDDAEDRQEFDRLLNDPSIMILDKKFQTQSESTFEGESKTVIERPFVRVEYEECSL
jgi:hypothetical protein